MAKAIFNNDAAISLLVNENPKRGASKARFAHYFKVKTVAEFLKAGGVRADVLWDAEHGYIKVTGLEVAGQAVNLQAEAEETKKPSKKAVKAKPEPKAKAPSKKVAKKEETPKDNAWPFKPAGKAAPVKAKRTKPTVASKKDIAEAAKALGV